MPSRPLRDEFAPGTAAPDGAEAPSGSIQAGYFANQKIRGSQHDGGGTSGAIRKASAIGRPMPKSG